MKKSLTALAVLLASQTTTMAYANAVVAHPSLISIPSAIVLPYGFFAGATGYYLEPIANGYDLSYGILKELDNVNSPRTYSKISQVNPTYKGAYDVYVGYLLPNHADMMLRYFNYNGGYTSNTTNIRPGQIFTTQNPLSDNAVAVQSYAKGRAAYRINQVDMLFGDTIKLMCNAVLHPFVGVRWTQLNRYMKTYGAFNSDTVDFFGEVTNISNVRNNIHEKSQFSGIGPMFGLSGRYRMPSGFEFDVNADGGVLVGNIFTKNWLASSGQVVGTNVTTTNYSRWRENTTHHIVPVVDLKLGVAFSLYDGDSCSNFRFEGGYQVSYYFNSVNRNLASGSPTVDGNFTALAAGGNNNSVGFQGPYLNFTLLV